MKKRKSIVNLLYQNIIVMLIFFIIIAFVVNAIVSVKLYNGAIVANNVVAKSIANHLQERMQEPQRDIAEMQQVLSQSLLTGEKADQYLNNILEANKFFIAIEIIDENGEVINSAPADFQSKGMDRSGELFYKDTLVEGKFYWSQLFTLIFNGEPTIAVSSIDEDKLFVVYLNIQKISQVSLDYSSYFGDHISLFITDRNGTYITNNDKQMLYQRSIDQDIELVKKSLDNGQSYFELKSQNQIVSTAFVENPGWYVSLYSSVDYIMTPIRNTYFLFYLFLIMIIGISFIYYRKAKSLSNSINHFSIQTKQIAAGDFNISIGDDKFRELHNLGENFKNMSKEIQKRDLLLEEYAYFDSLTGLPNRRSMMQQLEQYVEQQEPFAIVYFDLDQFKNINDSCGHYIGDMVLKEVSLRISESTMNQGRLARIGGDEFLYLLSGEDHETNIIKVVQNIIEHISESIKILDLDMYIGISAGIAFYPSDADNMVDLLKYSDMAMYAAKKEGPDKFACFTKELRGDFDRKIEIERQLRNAIEKEELSCFFQPQIELTSGRIIGFEALMRWNNELLGFVSPIEFIPLAEERNIIGDLTKWMFKKACSEIVQLQKLFDKKFKVSVNVSVVDLKRKDFAEEVNEIIQKVGLAPELLEIEITENMMIDNYDHMVDILLKLKKYGMRISLDDFGKGYSSLSYLNQLPIDTLKIDREFLESSQYHGKGYKLIGTIIDIANKFDYIVIAEGVETKEQLEILKQLNCYGGQGYLMCPPVPVRELIPFIEANNL